MKDFKIACDKIITMVAEYPTAERNPDHCSINNSPANNAPCFGSRRDLVANLFRNWSPKINLSEIAMTIPTLTAPRKSELYGQLRMGDESCVTHHIDFVAHIPQVAFASL